jgi:hypothetical protein
MTATRSALLAGVLCALALAGCGGGDSSTTSGSAATAPRATTSTTPSSAAAAAKPTASTPTTSTVPGISSAELAAAVAECKSVVKHAPTLSASLKGKVEGICDKAASGNLAAARAAAKEVCIEVINATPIPSADKTQALAACKTS